MEKSLSEVSSFAGADHYTEAQQVFEHKLVAIYFRFFAMYGIHSFSAKLKHRQEHENEVSSC